MPQLNFFHQERYDGGVRTGLGIDDELLYERFEPGGDESDPALRWYVDVIIEATEQPTNAAHVREWFVDHAETLIDQLNQVADKVQLGIDDWPLKSRAAIDGVGTVEIAVSCIRGLAEGELAESLRELAAHWREIVESGESVTSLH